MLALFVLAAAGWAIMRLTRGPLPPDPPPHNCLDDHGYALCEYTFCKPIPQSRLFTLTCHNEWMQP